MVEALSIICQIKIIYKKGFIKMVLDKNVEIFVMYIVFLFLDSKITIYQTWKA